MRQRGMVGLIAVVVAVLACRAVTLGQRSDPKPILLTQTTETKRLKWSRGEPQPVADENLALPLLGEATKPPDGIIRAEAPANDDPVGTVEAFLDRNRKEAVESIKTLTREAEALRARLQKVEAALARWQAIANALNQDVTPSTIVTTPESPMQLEGSKPTQPVEVPAPVAGDPPPAEERGPPSLPSPTVPDPSTVPLPPPR